MKNKIVLFGTGAYAKKVLALLEKYYEIEFATDNNSEKWGTYFENKYEIKSPEVLKKYSGKYILIAVDNKQIYETIYFQLAGERKIKHVNEALLEAANKKNETFYIEEFTKDIIEQINRFEKNIFVLTAPAHGNLGDQAQSYCIEKIIRNNDVNSGLWIFDEQQITKNYYELLYVIRQNLKKNDAIYLHSGYRLTDLYMASELIVEMMLEVFKGRKIVFLPQTIHFIDENVAKRLAEKMSSQVIIMCRDECSYDNAMRLFPNVSSMMFPDLVTSLIGRKEYFFDREGVLVCLRRFDDGESLAPFDVIDKTLHEFEGKNSIVYTDTTRDNDWHKIVQNREKFVFEEIERYAHYSLVITDRFHGTVFALAANTPVIVLPTKDHKVTASLKWFYEAEIKSVFFCDDYFKLGELVSKVLNEKKVIKNTDYLYEHYFKELDFGNIG